MDQLNANFLGGINIFKCPLGDEFETMHFFKI
jgi:hypothetical protein